MKTRKRGKTLISQNTTEFCDKNNILNDINTLNPPFQTFPASGEVPKMQEEPGKSNSKVSPPRSGLLRRSQVGTESSAVQTTAASTEVLCVEISDDSEDDHVRKLPQISIQLRQNTEVSPVDQELLKRFNSEFMSTTSKTTSKRRILNTPNVIHKKSKVSEGETSLLHVKEKISNKEESQEQEVIEIASVSSQDRNTRLKSSEPSSEFQVSFSSKSTQPRPRLKNTRPVDSFEDYLANITRKYGPRTSRERVLLWEFTMDVSDVEDFIEFEKRYEEYKTTKKYQTAKQKLDENKSDEPTTSGQTNFNSKSIVPPVSKKTPPKESPAPRVRSNASKKNFNPVPAEPHAEVDVLMSINTKTMEVFKNDTIMLDTNDTNTSGSVRLVWSDDDSIFKQTCLNPEIDKITKLIQSNLRKEMAASEAELNHNLQDKFKIPNVPRKYLPSKMDSSQKEEFYKYLGLGTRSPNGNCDDEHEPTDNKRRSLRVRRQQLQQSPPAVVEEKKSEPAQDSPTTKVEVESILQPLKEPQNDDKPQSLATKPRRTCGPVIKTAAPASTPASEGRLMSPRPDSKLDRSSANTSKNSESPGYDESECSQSSMVLMRHTYEKTTSPALQEYQRAIPFCRDLTDPADQTEQLEEASTPVKRKNGMKIPVNNRRIVTRRSNKSDAAQESTNQQSSPVDIMYNKFEEMKAALKETPQENSTSILLKFDYNKQTSIQSFETSPKSLNEPPLEALITLKSPTICSVTPGKNKLQGREVKKPTKATRKYHRTTTAKASSRTFKGKRFQRVRFLRSAVLNQRILRNRKFLLITAKSLGRKTKSRLIKQRRKRCNSEKSMNLLSPARVAKMDGTDGEEAVVQTPELGGNHEVQIIEVSQDEQKTDDRVEEELSAVIEVPVANCLQNPLNSENGPVLHAYYVQDLLVVIQEHTISCWKYLKVVQMLGKTQEWEQLGECSRNRNDYEVSAPYKNRMCLNDTNPIYMEMRARQFPEDLARECNLASVYVNVYSFDEWKASIVSYSVQLDTIRGLAVDVTYTTITNSRYFIMCWKQENPMGVSRTGLCKYALTPNLGTLASIREFKHMRHTINHLECISDNKLIGFGDSQITIWDHMTGDVLTNFDLEITLGQNVGSVLSSIQFESYLFLYQIRTTEAGKPQLKILAITLSANTPSFRLVYTHDLPASFACTGSSLCSGDFVLVSSAIGEEFLMLPHQPNHLYYFNSLLASTLKRFHCNGSREFVEISKDSLVIKTIEEYLMNFMK